MREWPPWDLMCPYVPVLKFKPLLSEQGDQGMMPHYTVAFLILKDLSTIACFCDNFQSDTGGFPTWILSLKGLDAYFLTLAPLQS